MPRVPGKRFARKARLLARQPAVRGADLLRVRARFYLRPPTLGQKNEWMRANPKVCLEVDEITNQSEWMSVIASGRYQELPEPQFTAEREHARKLLGKRHLWWQNALGERQSEWATTRSLRSSSAFTLMRSPAFAPPTSPANPGRRRRNRHLATRRLWRCSLPALAEFNKQLVSPLRCNRHRSGRHFPSSKPHRQRQAWQRSPSTPSSRSPRPSHRRRPQIGSSERKLQTAN